MGENFPFIKSVQFLKAGEQLTRVSFEFKLSEKKYGGWTITRDVWHRLRSIDFHNRVCNLNFFCVFMTLKETFWSFFYENQRYIVSKCLLSIEFSSRLLRKLINYNKNKININKTYKQANPTAAKVANARTQQNPSLSLLYIYIFLLNKTSFSR